MKTVTKDIGFYKTGDTVCIEVTNVGNDSDNAIADVVVSVDVPDGLSYSQGSFPQGAYDSVENEWLVGTLAAGADLTATFCFTITDDSEGPFTVTFTISAAGACADCDADRQFCVVVTGTSCSDIAACAGVDYSTNEVDTAVKWVDGKAIYRMVVDVSGYTPANAEEPITNGPTQASVDTIIKAFLIGTSTTSKFSDGDIQVNTTVDPTYFAVVLGTGITYKYLILEYTKV